MTANSLATIESLISDESNPDRRSENLSRLGVSLAQLGRIDEASQILVQLRSYLSSRYVLRILIRTMILEAIIPYYRDFANYSDRLRRAHALAVAANMVDLRGEVSVWIAHLGFNFDDFQNLSLGLSESIDRFESLDGPHRARLVLIVADALQYLGRDELAAQWYGVARAISRNAHDHGLMVAIEFNRIGMGLSNLRVSRALGQMVNYERQRNWVFELSSIRSLHHGFGAQALYEVLDLCDAFALEAQSKYLEAVDILKGLRRSGNLHRLGVSEHLIDLELMWCEVKAGIYSPSVDQIQEQYERVVGMAANDQALGVSFLKSIIKNYKNEFDATHLDRIAEKVGRAINQERVLLHEAIAPCLDRIESVKRNWMI